MWVLLKKLLRPLPLAIAGLAWLLRNRRNRRRFAIGVGVTLLVTLLAGELFLDRRHLPWRPLAIDDPAGVSTGLKLRLIDLGPESWCERLVNGSAELSLRALPEHNGDGDCGWTRAWHIEQSGGSEVKGSAPLAMRCPLAAGAHIWLTSIDRRARNLLGSGLARVHHVGSYSCRRMYNRPNGRMSEHAYANAWDVTGFELEDGRVVSVLRDWPAGGGEARFLRAVHQDACRVFNVVLGPDYNAAHADHFHVDMGGSVACR